MLFSHHEDVFIIMRVVNRMGGIVMYFFSSLNVQYKSVLIAVHEDCLPPVVEAMKNNAILKTLP